MHKIACCKFKSVQNFARCSSQCLNQNDSANLMFSLLNTIFNEFEYLEKMHHYIIMILEK